MRRLLYVVVGVLTSLALCVPALYAALFVGSDCDDGFDPPSPGSPNATYCDFWTHPDDRATLLLGLLFYGPAAAPAVGGMWASATGRAGAYWRATAAGLAIFVLHVVLAATLPG